MNEVTIVGNVVGQPVYRASTDKQMSLVRFTVKVNDDSGQPDDPALIHAVLAFDRLADNVNESLQQGLEVVVIGKLAQDAYQSEDAEGPRQLVILAKVVAPSLRFAPAVVKWEAHRPGAPQKHARMPDSYDGE